MKLARHLCDVHRCGGRAITLIGPGGAGKTTVGDLVAERLGVPFVDLDRRFGRQNGDIGEYIRRFGYLAYARENVETCVSMIQEGSRPCVAALSSGFMTYSPDIHPQYPQLRASIEHSPTTFVLIPSLDRETCVAETVRRQCARPFARPPAIEEEVIRERFPLYVHLRARTIQTMRPVEAVVEELLAAIRNADDVAGLTPPRP